MATSHSLLGEFDLLILGGRPLEAERVHCGEKRHERRAAPLGPGQVSPPDENKGRLSPGRGQGSPGMSSLPWAWELVGLVWDHVTAKSRPGFPRVLNPAPQP